MSRGLDRRMLVAALMAMAVGALLVAWPRFDAEAGGSHVVIGKAVKPPEVVTYALLSWRPSQVVGAVLVVLGLAAVGYLLGRRFGPRRGRWVLVGIGVGLAVTGAAVFWTTPPPTSAAETARAMGIPSLPIAYGRGVTWSAGQVAGLVVVTLGLLAAAVGVGAGVRVGARRG